MTQMTYHVHGTAKGANASKQLGAEKKKVNETCEVCVNVKMNTRGRKIK